MPKNTPMRRKDRKVTDEDAIRFILMNQEVLHLGLSDSDRIYVVPVNYAFTYEDGHLALYFHGAKEGLKYDILQEKPDVGFCIDGDQMVIPDEKYAGRFTMPEMRKRSMIHQIMPMKQPQRIQRRIFFTGCPR